MSKTHYIPEGYNSLTPYLIVKNATAAIECYKKSFGAQLLFKMDMPGGKVGHAEMKIGNSIFMLADEHPEQGHKGPKTLGGTPISMMVYVEDVDTVAALATQAGMKNVKPVENQFYGDRNGLFEDPFGHLWTIGTHVEDVSPEEMERRLAKMRG